MAIQSGAPGTSNTASGLSNVIGTRTLGAFTPGLGGRAGLGACASEDRRIGTTMSTRSMERILAKTLEISVPRPVAITLARVYLASLRVFASLGEIALCMKLFRAETQRLAKTQSAPQDCS